MICYLIHYLPRHPLINVAIKSMIQEIRVTKQEKLNLEKERDKFRADLNAANERSAALAVEIDEQNEKQDLVLKEEMKVCVSDKFDIECNIFLLKMLEQEWMDNFHNVQVITEKEIEKKSSTIQQLERFLKRSAGNLIIEILFSLLETGKEDNNRIQSKMMADLNDIALVNIQSRRRFYKNNCTRKMNN